jgi:DNA polymerase-3 subunit gamma/tau
LNAPSVTGNQSSTPSKDLANDKSAGRPSPTADPLVAGNALLKTPDRPASRSTRTTVNLTDLLKVESKKEAAAAVTPARREMTEPFTAEQFHSRWSEYALSRKKFQAEYQLLSQPYDLNGSKVILHLLSPVQESILATLRSELTNYLRENLKNDSILVNGLLREADEKKMIYTARDKFEYLQEKLPVLKELKERLGLDTDF